MLNIENGNGNIILIEIILKIEGYNRGGVYSNVKRGNRRFS